MIFLFLRVDGVCAAQARRFAVPLIGRNPHYEVPGKCFLRGEMSQLASWLLQIEAQGQEEKSHPDSLET